MEEASSAPAADETPSGEATASGPRSLEGEALAATARGFLGRRRALLVGGRRYPNECTGLVRAVYARHGVDLFAEANTSTGSNGVAAIWRFVRMHGAIHRDNPRPGDLVFFSETYDRNRDGRVNDGLTHVGIVERAFPDGTVHVIHRIAGLVVRYSMNLGSAHQRKDPTGQIVNDWLRMGKPPKLAGELFSGYGTLVALRVQEAFAKLDTEGRGAHEASAPSAVMRFGERDGSGTLDSRRPLGSETWPCSRRK